MNLLTHFKINSTSELELAYREFDDQTDSSFEEAKKEFNKGKTFMQCNSVGIVYLSNEVRTDSTEVSNPFAKKASKVLEEKEILIEAEKKEKPEPKIEKSPRRQRIEGIINAIEFYISDKNLDTMIKIIDLENQYEGQTPIHKILEIKKS